MLDAPPLQPDEAAAKAAPDEPESSAEVGAGVERLKACQSELMDAVEAVRAALEADTLVDSLLDRLAANTMEAAARFGTREASVTRQRLRLAAAAAEARLETARKASEVKLANQAVALEAGFTRRFEEKVRALAGGGGALTQELQARVDELEAEVQRLRGIEPRLTEVARQHASTKEALLEATVRAEAEQAAAQVAHDALRRQLDETRHECERCATQATDAARARDEAVASADELRASAASTASAASAAAAAAAARIAELEAQLAISQAAWDGEMAQARLEWALERDQLTLALEHSRQAEAHAHASGATASHAADGMRGRVSQLEEEVEALQDALEASRARAASLEQERDTASQDALTRAKQLDMVSVASCPPPPTWRCSCTRTPLPWPSTRVADTRDRKHRVVDTRDRE